MPPSFGGSRSGTSGAQARSPRAARRCARAGSRFWKTPPESTTTSSPRACAASAQAAAVAERDALVEALRDGRDGHARGDIGGDRQDRSARVEHAAPALVGQRQLVRRSRRGRRRPPRARSRPDPRRRRRRGRPQSAATASKSRPMLVVSGETVALSAMRATCRQRAASTAPASAAGSACASRRARRRARRRPCATARAPRAAPPGMRTGRSDATRSKRDEIAHEDLAAPDRAVGPVARAVVDRADGRPLEAVLREAGGEVRVVVLDARQLDAVELERVGRRGVVGMQVVGDERGLAARTAARSARCPAGRRAAPRSAPGRRCGGSPRRGARAPGRTSP